MEPPFKIGDNALSCACSIGIAAYPQHGEDIVGLCRKAEVAMDAAKRGGRKYAVYRPGNEYT